MQGDGTERTWRNRDRASKAYLTNWDLKMRKIQLYKMPRNNKNQL